MILLVALFSSFAAAHPGWLPGGGSTGEAQSTVGQRVALHVASDAVTMEYVAELPAADLYRDARLDGGQDYVLRRLTELYDGVTLTWDGQPLQRTRVEVKDPARAVERNFVELHVAAEAPLPSPSGTLGVRIGNFPDDPCYFATEVTLAGDLVVESSNLATVRAGRLRDNRHGAWLRDESGREPSLTIRPARWWEVAATDQPLPQRMAGLDTLRPPLLPIALAALSLIPIAWLGRALGRRAWAARNASPAQGDAPEQGPPA
jgi:hypothetical protein